MASDSNSPDHRKPIQPNPPRFQPSADPASIQIPGLDVTASVNDQIDQIDQLITFKLQNIDENFSKIQHLLASKLLPAVKRFAVATEPVREAAKFWTSFYEAAAQIRIPTYDEPSASQDETVQSELGPNATQASAYDNTSRSHTYEASITSAEGDSFGRAAFSSTPATANRHQAAQDSFSSLEHSNAPWEQSLVSPLVRLKQGIEDLTRDEDPAPTVPSAPPPSLNDTAQSLSVAGEPKGKGKGKGKAIDENPDASLLREALLQSLREIRHKPSGARHVSPLKVKLKPKTPVPKSLNPYLQPRSNPSEWSGIVDLRDSITVTPKRAGPLSGRLATPRFILRPREETADDSFDGLPPGMSPPRMMSPAAPPRSSAELGLLKLAQSPIKDAAVRIKRDLLTDVQKQSGGTSRLLYGRGALGGASTVTESSMSTIPTPPSLSRYTQHGGYGYQDGNSASSSTLDSMIRKVGLELDTEQLDDEDINIPLPPDRGLDSDSDSDSDEVHNTAHPSQAFLLASQQGSHHSCDDSSDDSLDDAGLQGGGIPIGPGEGFPVDDFDDDSFDAGGDVEEETVFGLPPAQREARLHAQRMDGLRMLGADLVEETIGMGHQRTERGLADDTPTPWGRMSHE